MLLLIGLMSTLFMCSFSSILSAMTLITITISALSVMYWNMMSVIPLYLFALFTVGGLYVLVGFVMMADLSDLDKIISSQTDLMILLVSTLLSVFYMSYLESPNSVVDEPMKLESKETHKGFSSIYLFLIFFLFLFLFIMFMMTKGMSGGLTFWGEMYFLLQWKKANILAHLLAQ